MAESYFNEDQQAYMRDIFSQPREKRCDCGWAMRGQCFGQDYGKPEQGGFLQPPAAPPAAGDDAGGRGVSKLDEAIDRGDARELLREFVKTERAASEGRFCECAEPDLTGRKSHLCFGCGLYNLARKDEIEAAMVAPHPFEPRANLKHQALIDFCCDFCSQARAHPRHMEPPAAQQPPEGSA